MHFVAREATARNFWSEVYDRSRKQGRGLSVKRTRAEGQVLRLPRCASIRNGEFNSILFEWYRAFPEASDIAADIPVGILAYRSLAEPMGSLQRSFKMHSVYSSPLAQWRRSATGEPARYTRNRTKKEGNSEKSKETRTCDSLSNVSANIGLTAKYLIAYSVVRVSKIYVTILIRMSNRSTERSVVLK